MVKEKKEEWPRTIKGVNYIEKGQKVKVKNTTRKGEIVDFDETTANVKFVNGKVEKFPLNKLRFINEQMPNAIGAEIGSEPTVHDKKFRFNMDSPYPILILDLARQIGTFLHIDFDKMSVEDLYQRMQDKADEIATKQKGLKPKTVADWIKIAKFVTQNIMYKGGENESDKQQSKNMTNENKLRIAIREEIKKILKEDDYNLAPTVSYKKSKPQQTGKHYSEGKGTLIVTKDGKNVINWYKDPPELVPLKKGMDITPYIRDYNKYSADYTIKDYGKQKEWKSVYVNYDYDKNRKFDGKFLKEAFDYEPIDKQLKDKGIFVTYKKPWKGAEETAIAFIGKTYPYRDVFSRITQMHRGGNKRESDKRFRWSSDFKFWYTYDSESAELAKKYIVKGYM